MGRVWDRYKLRKTDCGGHDIRRQHAPRFAPDMGWGNEGVYHLSHACPRRLCRRRRLLGRSRPDIYDRCAACTSLKAPTTSPSLSSDAPSLSPAPPGAELFSASIESPQTNMLETLVTDLQGNIICGIITARGAYSRLNNHYQNGHFILNISSRFFAGNRFGWRHDSQHFSGSGKPISSDERISFFFNHIQS